MFVSDAHAAGLASLQGTGWLIACHACLRRGWIVTVEHYNLAYTIVPAYTCMHQTRQAVISLLLPAGKGPLQNLNDHLARYTICSPDIVADVNRLRLNALSLRLVDTCLCLWLLMGIASILPSHSARMKCMLSHTSAQGLGLTGAVMCAALAPTMDSLQPPSLSPRQTAGFLVQAAQFLQHSMSHAHVCAHLQQHKRLLSHAFPRSSSLVTMIADTLRGSYSQRAAASLRNAHIVLGCRQMKHVNRGPYVRCMAVSDGRITYVA